jgi:hypothetical protein
MVDSSMVDSSMVDSGGKIPEQHLKHGFLPGHSQFTIYQRTIYQRTIYQRTIQHLAKPLGDRTGRADEE